MQVSGASVSVTVFYITPHAEEAQIPPSGILTN